MRSRGYTALVVLALALPAAGGGPADAQTPSAPVRQTWSAEWTYELQAPGRPYSQHTRWRVSFTGVEEIDTNGTRTWLSRHWEWSHHDVFEQFGTFAYDPAVGRYQVNLTRTCIGGGPLELGPGTGAADSGMPTLQAKCEEVATPVDGRGPVSRRPSVEPVNQAPALRPPQEGCSVSEYSRHVRGDSVGTSSYSLTVAPYVDAVMQVSTGSAYGRFVPAPGRTLTLTASSQTVPARFRFELDPERTSRFPGYATNARVDRTFFEKEEYGLAHLRDEYADDGPDLMFDRTRFRAEEWARIEPGIVETRLPQMSAAAVVTAMDYGAVGRLRAFVQVDDCGGWQPVRIVIDAESRPAVSIPLDEDDNLMADALEAYHFLDANADDEAEPEGNGMEGDGLTAFEEYRGLLQRGVGCGSEATEAVYGELELRNQSQVAGWSDEHMRTSPRRKDLFVHTPDPELALVLPAVAHATGLDLHVICEPHYESNESRVVNFTLHRSGIRSWQGRSIALDEPQHGLYLEPVEYLSLRGLAIPVTEGQMGPPGLTRAVQVRKPRPDSSNVAHRGRLELPELVHTIVHEMSHGVGVPHHGDTVENWQVVLGRQNIVTYLSLQQHAGGPPDFTQPDSLPELPDSYHAPVNGRSYLTSLLVEPGGDCVEGAPGAVYYHGDRFAGCRADSIARRGQQNSGEFECPMRYSGSDYYEAPGTVAQFRGTGLVTYRSPAFPRPLPGHLVDSWGGRLLRYRNDLDRDGTGELCRQTRGTGINGLPGDLNHNGDAGRDRACAAFVVVNDLAARGVP